MNNPKFRAWDKKLKKWVDGGDGFHLTGEAMLIAGIFQTKYYSENVYKRLYRDVEITQQIEKNDKNNHELYLGDIVKHPQYLGLWELVYTPFATVGIQQIRHVANNKGQDCFGQVITLIQDWEQIEYVGNKFENAELLKGEKKKKNDIYYYSSYY